MHKNHKSMDTGNPPLVRITLFRHEVRPRFWRYRLHLERPVVCAGKGVLCTASHVFRCPVRPTSPRTVSPLPWIIVGTPSRTIYGCSPLYGVRSGRFPGGGDSSVIPGLLRYFSAAPSVSRTSLVPQSSTDIRFLFFKSTVYWFWSEIVRPPVNLCRFRSLPVCSRRPFRLSTARRRHISSTSEFLKQPVTDVSSDA